MQSPIYFEDLQIGQILRSQRKTMTESEIIDFAWKYDPQPFHISVPDAEESHFGGIISSGFQTLAVASGWPGRRMGYRRPISAPGRSTS